MIMDIRSLTTNYSKLNKTVKRLKNKKSKLFQFIYSLFRWKWVFTRELDKRLIPDIEFK